MDTSAPTDAYVDALCQEMTAAAQEAAPHPLSSIFFGGGTPSLMAPETVKTLIEKAENLFGFTNNIEITLEANPTSSEAEKFKAFAHAGVNRISIGLQSTQENDLAFLGREHNLTQALHAIDMAQETDVRVSLDVIYGLPGQDVSTWQESLQTLTALGTSHLSAYQLTIEKNTKFYADMRKGKLSPISDHAQADFYHATNHILKQAGFAQYEVSNYAKNNQHCQHNTHIWQYGSYIGLGAGAHGRTRQHDGTCLATRNYKMPHAYIEAVNHTGNGRYQADVVPPHAQVHEALLLGLRLSQGLPLARLVALNNAPWQESLSQEGIELMVTNGFLIQEESATPQNPPHLKPTPQGLAMLEGVLSYIVK